MLKKLMKQLLKRKNNEVYRYPTAVVCLDSILGEDIARRSEHILKHDGYVVIKVTNFKSNGGSDSITKMYDEIDMQAIRNADIVFGVTTKEGANMETSVAEALKYARDNGIKTDMLHFV